MLTKLVYEDIKAVHKTFTFGRAIYGGLGVVVLKEKGYINATKLCSLGGKRYSSWSRLDIATSLFEEVALDAQICVGSLSISVDGNQADITGTYLHQDLIVHVASWVSSKFGIRVSKIVNDFFSNERIKELRLELLKKEGTIKTLEEKVDEQTRKIDKQGKRIKLLLANSEFMQDTLFDVRDICKDKMQKVDELDNKVEILLDHFVPPESDFQKVDQLKITYLDVPIEEKGIVYNLYIQRGQRLSLNRQALYRGKVILIIDPLANAQNLFNQVKKLPYVTSNNNKFSVNEEELNQFLEDVKAINESRYHFNPPKPSKEDILNRKSITELRALCKTLGYGSCSSFKTKDNLVRYIICRGY